MLILSRLIKKEKLNKNEGLEMEDKYGVRALHLACTRGAEMVKVLLQNGANINAPDQVGNTPIFHTIINDDVDAMKVLLDHATKLPRSC